MYSLFSVVNAKINFQSKELKYGPSHLSKYLFWNSNKFIDQYECKWKTF